ncbi:hypothetical protein Cs7R123_63040 [Catellatospora sp. TT07R-123]|uniref:serine/threonine-protein kinase n=1 Tax=Catellatospora sp. TT07R-123 TaxID=2733863 RepID=UPI001B01DFB2|nr:protein kinase [Catellatospora sp. TT07R-123]GHJ48962.1 hypothetical protein Cs7R123_63040 [Catellatospora sp. TT07R-123]
MTEPERPSELDETLLDEGRARLFPPRYRAESEATLLDAGRHRQAAPPVDWPGDGTLPEPLAQRYERLRELPVPASQADLYLVRRRSDGAEAVLKHYHAPRTPHPDLVAHLTGTQHHTIRFLEFGPGYEIMEYARGGTLLRPKEAAPGGFTLPELHAIVQQLASALISLHRLGLLHRDVKPANVLLRSAAPLDVALADFGLAGPVGETVPQERLNPAYQPPESVLRGRITQAADWWGLGMTIRELASGDRCFDGLEAEDIKDHFTASRLIDVSVVPDDRLRGLCQGLLCPDERQRWGAGKVGEWLVGRDPSPPAAGAGRRPHTPAPGAATQPFGFRGVLYHHRDELAAAMATEWNYAVDFLLARSGLEMLRVWLDEFTDDEGATARQGVDTLRQDPGPSRHVLLLRVLRLLDPGFPAVFRNHSMSRQHLLALAHQALRNEGDAASVLGELWRERLLPSFDPAATGAAGTGGGEALTDLDQQWQQQHDRWLAGAGTVSDPEARQVLQRLADGSGALAYSLLAALNQPDAVEAAHEAVRATLAGLPERLPWFRDLAADPDLVWVALPLCGHAKSRAQTLADHREAQERAQQQQRMASAYREWSRRQNRPVALGWAVAGVCLIAVCCVVLIVASDRVGWVGDRAVDLAWIGAATCLGVTLVAECLLAAEVGGRFHARYSVPGAAGIALQPLGRWMQRAPLPAAGVILAVLAGLVLGALRYPEAVGISAMVLHLGWVVHRWRDWRTRTAAEDAAVADQGAGFAPAHES